MASGFVYCFPLTRGSSVFFFAKTNLPGRKAAYKGRKPQLTLFVVYSYYIGGINGNEVRGKQTRIIQVVKDSTQAAS